MRTASFFLALCLAFGCHAASPKIYLYGQGAENRDWHPELLTPFYRDMHVATNTSFKPRHVCHDNAGLRLVYCVCNIEVPLAAARRSPSDPYVINASEHGRLLERIRKAGCPR